jgi:hypothetical protein
MLCSGVRRKLQISKLFVRFVACTSFGPKVHRLHGWAVILSLHVALCFYRRLRRAAQVADGRRIATAVATKFECEGNHWPELLEGWGWYIAASF